MFQQPFSFEGRIRRTEFGVSFIISIIGKTIMGVLATGIAGANDQTTAIILSYVLATPFFIFLWAQGAKRCHDIGWSGWVQLIPFVLLIIIFMDGEQGENKYGADPKADLTQNNF